MTPKEKQSAWGEGGALLKSSGAVQLTLRSFEWRDGCGGGDSATQFPAQHFGGDR